MVKVLGVLVFTFLFTVCVFFFSRDVPPASGFYPFRRLSEKLLLMTKQDAKDKIAYQRYLVDARLEDFRDTLRGTNDNDRLSASLRYAATAGELTAMVEAYDSSREKTLVLQQFSRQLKVLKAEETAYSGHDKKYVEDAVHYLEHYTEELH